MKKSTAAALVAALATATAPLVITPVAYADICAGVHGRFVGVSGCGAPIARGVEAGAAVGGAAAIASSDPPMSSAKSPATPSRACPTSPHPETPAEQRPRQRLHTYADDTTNTANGFESSGVRDRRPGLAAA